MPPSARLDVENEDEATSHWQSSKDETITLSTDAQDEEEEKNESSAALHPMFHKATNQQDQRQGDIQLDKVEQEHNSMNYASRPLARICCWGVKRCPCLLQRAGSGFTRSSGELSSHCFQ